jgi:hypothetical protein
LSVSGIGWAVVKAREKTKEMNCVQRMIKNAKKGERERDWVGKEDESDLERPTRLFPLVFILAMDQAMRQAVRNK